jgi:hypothetical protein
MRELKAKYELFLHARMYASAQVIYLQIERVKQCTK